MFLSYVWASFSYFYGFNAGVIEFTFWTYEVKVLWNIIRPFVCSSICLFFCLAVCRFFFLELLLETSIFLDQIRVPSIARFFWKNFILGLLSQSVPKLAINKVLQVLKIDAWSLSDFSHEVINNLYGKILVLRF